MEASRGQLMAALSSLGFADYDELMHRILVAEVSSRTRSLGASRAPATALATRGARGAGCAALTVEVGSLFERLGSLLELDEALAQKAAFIRQLAADLHLLSLNAQIRAASLGEDGRTLQVVAQQMSGSARATSVSAVDICACISEANAAVRAAASQIATSHLSVEMMSDFVRELDGARADENRRLVTQLAEVVTANVEATCDCVRSAASQLQKLRQRLDDFVKEIRTLQILHVTGRVESVRCLQGQEVSGIFEEVFAKTRDAREKLSLLVHLVDAARVDAPRRELIRDTLSSLVAG
jgi:hypothetical protein